MAGRGVYLENGSAKVKILYVLGRGRGGSTIFANVLGGLEGFFSAGEIRALLDPVLESGAPCGCGAPMDRCVVWSSVLDELSDVDLAAAARWQREVVRERNLVRLLRQKPSEMDRWPALEGYVDTLTRLYGVLAGTAGATVVVDSSKRPSYGAVLRLLPDVAVYYVHLVRDPRASAYSWKHRRYESAMGGEVTRRNAVDSSVRWMVLNLEAEALLRVHGSRRGLRMRYEQFVEDPQGAVDGIASLLGVHVEKSPFVGERTVRLGVNHTVAGNPARFSTGTVELKDAGEWRDKQNRLDRWMSTAVSSPLLHLYGYRMRPSAPGPRGRSYK